MMMFADSSFLIALYDNSDQYHNQAHLILQKIKQETPQIIISDYIFDETTTYLLVSHKYYGYKRAQTFDSDILEKQFCKLILLTERLFQQAREVFLRFNKDKLWSFTDCTSYAIMKDYGIQRVLTFDKNFKEMGFTMVK